MNKRIKLVLKITENFHHLIFRDAIYKAFMKGEITKISDEEFQNAINVLEKYLKDHIFKNSVLICADRLHEDKGRKC
jgi:hypothetical protein